MGEQGEDGTGVGDLAGGVETGDTGNDGADDVGEYGRGVGHLYGDAELLMVSEV